jgi:hypothetical protein
MMTGTAARPFAELFGGLPGDGDIASLARAAARAGYVVLPIIPGKKKPLCTLTERQAKTADRHAAQEAKTAGKRNWEKVRHPCGIYHAMTDPAVAHRIFKRLAAQHPHLNIAVDVYRSRLLVVDADTAEEMRSFTALWAQQENVPALVDAAPTVRSPGVLGPDDQWTHSDGGHFYFLLEDGVNLGDIGATRSIPIGLDEDNQAQLKVSGYVLVPPSVRPEGEYRMASDAHVAPTWLIECVQLHVAARHNTRRHREDRCLDNNDPLTLAQAAIPWSAILEPHGWVLWHKTDRCACEIWTAPGEHASSKSATAHDPGCGSFDTADGFLHMWTDNPPDGLRDSGKQDFSKIQFIAWSNHGGEMGAAMAELGIDRRPAGPGPTVISTSTDLARLAEIQEETPPEPAPTVEDAEVEGEVEVDPVTALLAELIPASGLDHIPPPVPLVDGILDRNCFARVIGASGHGKSFAMIDIAGHVGIGKSWNGHECTQGNVVYMVAEGLSGIRPRVRAWEAYHGVELGDRVKFLPRAVQVMQQTDWLVWVAAMIKEQPILIVIDTQARITVGAKENEATDMGVLVDRAELLRKETGACVVLIHHKGHRGDHGRGSTVVPAALDIEISVTKQGKNRITVLSEKQKDREDFHPISLDLVPVGESAVLVPAGTDKPFDKTPIDENSPAPDRLAKLMHLTFADGNGATKSEAWAVVHEKDRGVNGRPMSRAAFYRAWTELEARDVLLHEETEAGKRWVLDLAEADRLGLRQTSNGSLED